MNARPHFTDLPCAAPGLKSYRYPTGLFGWIMIGAKDDGDALNEADRSREHKGASLTLLEVWDGTTYRPVI
jgi:hypothetical protein